MVFMNVWPWEIDIFLPSVVLLENLIAQVGTISMLILECFSTVDHDVYGLIFGLIKQLNYTNLKLPDSN